MRERSSEVLLGAGGAVANGFTREALGATDDFEALAFFCFYGFGVGAGASSVSASSSE